MGRKEEVYVPALTDKKIPILTLDNKWHRLFNTADTTLAILKLEDRLNELLKRQGKCNKIGRASCRERVSASV